MTNQPSVDDWHKVLVFVVAALGVVGTLAGTVYVSAQALKKIKDWLNSPTAEDHAKILGRVTELELHIARLDQTIADMHREQTESATARQNKIGDRIEDLINLVREKRGQ